LEQPHNFLAGVIKVLNCKSFKCIKFECFLFGLHYAFHLSLHLNRKLKKLIRTLKEKESPKEKDEERPPQQWNLDYALAPFEGLTPEYMEMSESAFTRREKKTAT